MKPVDPRLVARTRALRPYLARVVGLTLLDAGLLLAQIFLLGHALAGVVTHASSAGAVGRTALWLVAVTALRALLGSIATVSGRRAASKVTAELRYALLDRLVTDATHRPPGEVGLLATRGVDALEPYVTDYLPTVIASAIVPVVVVAAAFAVDRTTGFLLLVTLPLVPVFMALVGRYSADHAARSWASLQRLAGQALDLITGLPTLKLFGRQHAQARTIERLGERSRKATMRALRSAFLSAFVLELAATLAVALVAVSVGLRLVGSHVDLASAFVVILLAPECFAPLRRMGAAYHTATEGLEAATDICNTLDAPRPVRGDEPVPARVRVSCVAVSVTHEGRTHATPEAASLIAEPGKVVALVGPNGAGKSTVLAVLRGRVAPDAGRVLVGDVPLAAFDAERWNAAVAWVPQRSTLGDDTVRSNIALGAPDASDAALTAIARDLGIDHLLAQPARALSAGERQRVALARAVLRVEAGGARLALLDEPTANLDSETEALVVETVHRLARGGAAVVVVAHRPALVAAADRVVVIAPEHVDLVAAAAPHDRVAAAAGLIAAAPTTSGSGPRAGRRAPDVPTAPPRRWLWREAQPVRRRLGLAIGLAAAAMLAGLALTGCAAWLLSRASEHPPVLELGIAVVVVRALALAKAALRYLERLASHDAVLRFIARLRVRVYERLAVVAPAGIAGWARGDLLSRVVGDLDVVQDLALRAVLPPLTAALGAVAVVAAVLVVFPAGAGVLGAGLLVGGLAVPFAAAALERRAGERVAAERVALATTAVDIAETAEELAAYGAGAARLTAITQGDARLARATRREAGAAAFGDGAEAGLSGAVAAALLVIGATAVRAGSLDVRLLATIVLLGWMLPEVVGTLPTAARRGRGLRAATARVTGVLGADDPVADPLIAVAPPTGPVGVEIEGLAVRWPHAAEPALRHVDLSLPPGSRTVLVGASGAGKSTLAAALVRFLPIAAGTIRLGGVDVAEMRGDDVRALVGWCAQDAHFFDTSVGENLRIAAPHASDAQLEAAVRAVRLDRWLASLPRGLETAVGVGGVQLSGGEIQRLALARELLADRPVIVFDEPTANVDAETADLLVRDLLDASEGRTVLMITHRLLGIDRADRVVTLAGGRITSGAVEVDAVAV